MLVSLESSYCDDEGHAWCTLSLPLLHVLQIHFLDLIQSGLLDQISLVREIWWFRLFGLLVVTVMTIIKIITVIRLGYFRKELQSQESIKEESQDPTSSLSSVGSWYLRKITMQNRDVSGSQQLGSPNNLNSPDQFDLCEALPILIQLFRYGLVLTG